MRLAQDYLFRRRAVEAIGGFFLEPERPMAYLKPSLRIPLKGLIAGN